jgi:hypothetical protein
MIDANKLIFFFSSSLSPLTASLFITICGLRHYGIIGLVYSIHDPTEVAIQKMIDASQRMIRINYQEGEELGGMSPPLKRHSELQITTLQNAPRDADELRQLLKARQRKRNNFRIDCITARRSVLQSPHVS